jgi:hypothetical protein
VQLSKCSGTVSSTSPIAQSHSTINATSIVHGEMASSGMPTKRGPTVLVGNLQKNLNRTILTTFSIGNRCERTKTQCPTRPSNAHAVHQCRQRPAVCQRDSLRSATGSTVKKTASWADSHRSPLSRQIGATKYPCAVYKAFGEASVAS